MKNPFLKYRVYEDTTNVGPLRGLRRHRRLLPCLTTRVQSPGPMWWEEKTNAYKLASDLHICAVWMPTHAPQINQEKYFHCDVCLAVARRVKGNGAGDCTVQQWTNIHFFSPYNLRISKTLSQHGKLHTPWILLMLFLKSRLCVELSWKL